MAAGNETFGQLLRRFREVAGYSQEHLAERAELSANAVGALERGERKRPYPDTLRRLADALGLDDSARGELAAALRRSPDGAESHADIGHDPAPGRDKAVDRHPSAAIIGLPGEATPFIGREHEVADIRRLLEADDTRLLTLVGPGGVGKTRLALHIAHAMSERFDAVVWVDLAPLAHPSLVTATIGRTVGLEEPAHGDPAEALRDWLQDRHALLALDNVEHLLDAVPDLATLLADCPRLRMLATSRSPLRIRGEREFHVPPLALPPVDPDKRERDAAASDLPSEPTTLDQDAPDSAASEVAAFDSVRFFVWHAQQRDPSFELTGTNASAVSAICRRLDGLPLALELVAARITVLSPVEMLARVDHLMPLLIGGARDLPERQRTMRAAIAWSEDLLGPEETSLFRRLSVFAGGWMLDAAETVGARDRADAVNVLDRLDALVAQSLVTVSHERAETRYGMLEPIRQYALEHLAPTEERLARRHHAQYFADFAERANQEIEGRSSQSVWVERLVQEQDNLRAALTWAEHADDGAEIGLRIGTALWRFWEMRWQVAEGDGWLTRALVRSSGMPPEPRAKALNAVGNLARDLGHYARATALHEECLAIRRQQGLARGIAVSLNNLGVIARDQGDAERTQLLCQESLELFRQADDRHGSAIALISLGAAAGQQGDLQRARAHYEESLHLFRAEGDAWHTAWVLTYLAEILVRAGDLEAARAQADEALAMHRTAGEAWGVATALGVLGRADLADGALEVAARCFAEAVRVAAEARVERAIPAALEDLAAVLLAGGDPERAARLAGAAVAARTAGGIARAPAPDEAHQAALDALRAGPHAAAWAAGHALSRDQLLAEAATVPDTLAEA